MASSPLAHSKLDTPQRQDLKSREYLTDLLDHQIDRNELLEMENMRLEAEQRKLVQLLDRKSAQINALRLAKTTKTKLPQKTQQNVQIPNQNPSQSCLQTCHQQPQHSIHQQKNNNDSTAILHNTTIGESNNEVIQMLKNNIREKEEEMKRMREYYSRMMDNMEKERNRIGDQYDKEYKQEIQEYQAIISKQKNRINQLMNALEANQEQKYQLQAEIAKQSEKKPTLSQSKAIQELQAKILKLEQKHEAELIAIEQVHQQQKQALLREHQQQLETVQKNTIHKIQQAQQKSQDSITIFQQQLQQKQKQIQALTKQTYQLQSKLKEQLIRFQEQCELVMNIQHDRERMVEEIGRLGDLVKEKEEEMGRSQANRVNIDNIHKQYSSKLQEKDKELTQSNARLNQTLQQLEQKNQSLNKIEAKLQESVKKYNQQIYVLEMESKKYKEEIQSTKEEMQYLEKENKLKDEDNKRLLAKINKESEKKEQYVKKLEDKIIKLEAELADYEVNMQEKDTDIVRYKEQMTNFIQKLKEQMGKKDKQLFIVLKENEKKGKEMKQMHDNYESSAAVLHNQCQQANKKYNSICDRLRIVEQQKNNFKSFYDELSKQLKTLEAKKNKLQQENQKLIDENDKMQKQIDYLKEEILSNNLGESEKQELAKLRNQAAEQKARVNKLNQNIAKVKDQNARALKINFQLQQRIDRAEGENTKLRNQLQMKKEKIEQYEQRIQDLEEDLRRRCKELETSMPYVNKVIEQKKANELQLEKRNNDIKRLQNIVQMAKKSKAEEIVNLNRELESYKNTVHKLQGLIKDNEGVIQRFNLEKIKMLRENTAREDLIAKYEKQNKTLRENLVESQQNVQKLMHFVGIAESAMDNVQLEQSFNKKSQRK